MTAHDSGRVQQPGHRAYIEAGRLRTGLEVEIKQARETVAQLEETTWTVGGRPAVMLSSE